MIKKQLDTQPVGSLTFSASLSLYFPDFDFYVKNKMYKNLLFIWVIPSSLKYFYNSHVNLLFDLIKCNINGKTVTVNDRVNYFSLVYDHSQIVFFSYIMYHLHAFTVVINFASKHGCKSQWKAMLYFLEIYIKSFYNAITRSGLFHSLLLVHSCYTFQMCQMQFMQRILECIRPGVWVWRGAL